jgi:hypothetical protein
MEHYLELDYLETANNSLFELDAGRDSGADGTKLFVYSQIIWRRCESLKI